MQQSIIFSNEKISRLWEFPDFLDSTAHDKNILEIIIIMKSYKALELQSR